jgi:hypothetical protein
MRTRSLPVRVVVRLPSGEHRAVDCAATELATPAGSSPALTIPSSCISAHILLPLVPHVRRLLNTMEERTNETSPNSVQAPAGLDDSARRCSTEPLARADAGPTATTGTGAGEIGPADAPAKFLRIDGEQS